jgi:hypothetical protein
MSLKIYMLINASDKKLFAHRKCNLSMCRSKISSLFFYYSRVYMWLWRADFYHRYQKWSTLHHLSNIVRWTRESKEKMINSYSWFHSISDSTSKTKSYHQDWWTMNSWNDEFCLKTFFSQHSSNDDDERSSSIV